MGDPTGFLKVERKGPSYRPVEERLQDYREIPRPLSEDQTRLQASRCMNCGIPFCHNGCPLGNLIPDWNDLVYRSRWREAIDQLHSTNNFPDFTGRVCPAPCEASCTLNIRNNAVTIKEIELRIIEYAFAAGWVKPEPPERETGKMVAVIGSGPAGLACAQQLRRAGHQVTVFEKDDRIGGLLSFGIPDFKLEKHVVQRRVDQMISEGVVFRAGVNVGVDIHGEELMQEFDAICLTMGAREPRDLQVPGRELRGIHFAMDFLEQQNRRVAGESIPEAEAIHAGGKRVVILGGGDTGADCLGTSHRQGALEVRQFEFLPKPPEMPRDYNPYWPYWPMTLRSSSAHEEGGLREWSVNTRAFSGSGGRVEALHGVRLEWTDSGPGGRPRFSEIPGSEFTIPVDLVLLAIGYTHVEQKGVVEQLGLELTPRGDIRASTETFATSVPKVFAAGDARRGQSLVVWAIWEGREAAHHIDTFLMGRSDLPLRDRPVYHLAAGAPARSGA